MVSPYPPCQIQKVVKQGCFELQSTYSCQHQLSNQPSSGGNLQTLPWPPYRRVNTFVIDDKLYAHDDSPSPNTAARLSASSTRSPHQQYFTIASAHPRHHFGRQSNAAVRYTAPAAAPAATTRPARATRFGANPGTATPHTPAKFISNQGCIKPKWPCWS